MPVNSCIQMTPEQIAQGEAKWEEVRLKLPAMAESGLEYMSPNDFQFATFMLRRIHYLATDGVVDSPERIEAWIKQLKAYGFVAAGTNYEAVEDVLVAECCLALDRDDWALVHLKSAIETGHRNQGDGARMAVLRLVAMGREADVDAVLGGI